MIWTIIILVVAFIGLRLLRLAWKGADALLFVIGLGVSITLWITNGFWSGLICFVVYLIAHGIVIGSNTEVKRGNLRWEFECSKCGYNKVDIIDENEYAVKTRCPRCGNEQIHGLLH